MVVARRFVQIAAFVVFAVIIWMTRYPLHVQINPAFLFKIDPLVMFITALAERVLLPGLILAAMTIALTLIFGRVFCGWLCPLGTLSDAMTFFGRIFYLRKKGLVLPGGVFIKYFLLVVIVILAVFGVQFVWLFDPITICVRSLSFSVIPLANSAFEWAGSSLIQATNYYQPLETFYQTLKEALFDPRRPVFPHGNIISAVFAGILLLTLLTRRWWCRYLCPLGAMLGAVAQFSFLKRHSPICAGSCRLCKDVCRMGAINEDNSYVAAECVVCLDCVKDCPGRKSSFMFFFKHFPTAPDPVNIAVTDAGISRSQFVAWGSSALAMLLPTNALAAIKFKKRTVLRPPAALPEAEFVQRCVRCGNCMKVCVTNCLQPVLLESGAEGIWTPKIDAKIGYCEYGCTLCGHVCPTGALAPLTEEEKAVTKMGLAQILPDTCIPWATGQDCIVCEEHCPTAQKAIKITEKHINGRKVLVPIIDKIACVGCGLCENVCPANPKGVIVTPLN
jgi:polyferredoxin/NAD-dependent dihydropyrimidine dehydrogenase PreA subunit